MSNEKYDTKNAVVTVPCDQVPEDTIHLHQPTTEHGPWFAMNSFTTGIRITVCPSLENLERLYAGLGRLLGKV